MRAVAIFLIGEVFGRKSGAKGKFRGTSINFDKKLYSKKFASKNFTKMKSYLKIILRCS